MSVRSKRATARFYFNGEVEGREPDAMGNHWFNEGDEVPAEVVEQVGSHLFEQTEGEREPELPEAPEAEEPQELPKRRRVPRQRTSPENE